jgi:hypothetical protein
MDDNIKLNGFSVEGTFEQVLTNKIHNGLKCYEIVDGTVTCIAFVDKPAHGANFKITDMTQRIVTGPLLIPDFMIYRHNRITNEEYYIYFTKEL